ncbi:MAG: elongation factor G, partial [candidate division WOR-3 bacterium]|nr:elongation factor G [candidate division WOR-3 bacterium]
KPALLEPIAKVKIYVDEADIGSIMNDLNSRRGKILGIEKFSDTISYVNVYVPYAEMLTYSAALNSITKGKGRFEMEFSHYDFLPFNEYDKAKKQAEEMKKEEEARKSQ